MLQERLPAKFTQSLSYEPDGARAGEKIRSISARFVKFTFDQAVRWIPIFNEWHFVRTIFHENLSRIIHRAERGYSVHLSFSSSKYLTIHIEF